jgi:hypothetical protein
MTDFFTLPSRFDWNDTHLPPRTTTNCNRYEDETCSARAELPRSTIKQKHPDRKKSPPARERFILVLFSLTLIKESNPVAGPGPDVLILN